MDGKQVGAKLTDLVQRYKYVVFVLLAGILLMVIPAQKKDIRTNSSVTVTPEKKGTEDLQKSLEEILSYVDGAGKVRVLLTQEAGESILFQENENTSTDENSSTVRKDAVIISDAGRAQAGLVRQTNPPKYRGAVVICQGADRASVRLAIMEAVSNAAGLSFDSITVLKMK